MCRLALVILTLTTIVGCASHDNVVTPTSDNCNIDKSFFELFTNETYQVVNVYMPITAEFS